MNNKPTLSTKIIATFIMLFSIIKMLIFPQRLFYIISIMISEFQGKHIYFSEKEYAFNIWVIFTSFVESFLFFVLFYYVLLIFRGKYMEKKIIKLCFIIILLFYPVLLISDYFILGRNSLMGILPALFTSAFLLFFIIYFLVFYKEKTIEDTDNTSDNKEKEKGDVPQGDSKR